jgi:hypothetical protein
MPRLSTEPINASDIRDFCESESDFSFELQTLALLNELGVSCEHGGVYEDPITQKARQYDIRGLLQVNQINRVRLAIECKNIRPNFPLVVFTVPRSKEESYHEFISTSEPQKDKLCLPSAHFSRNGVSIRQKMSASMYPSFEPVGKSCSQVGRDQQSTTLKGSDSDAYDKWWQAIQSAHDLVDMAENDWKLGRQRISNTLILPTLVVPNGRLWVVHHKSDGSIEGVPVLTDRASLYVDKFVPSSNKFSGIGTWISHIEIVTHAGLTELVSSFGGASQRISPFVGY